MKSTKSCLVKLREKWTLPHVIAYFYISIDKCILLYLLLLRQQNYGKVNITFSSALKFFIIGVEVVSGKSDTNLIS